MSLEREQHAAATYEADMGLEAGALRAAATFSGTIIGAVYLTPARARRLAAMLEWAQDELARAYRHSHRRCP